MASQTGGTQQQGTQTVFLTVHNPSRHLKLTAELDKVSLRGGPVVWNVTVEYGGATEVVLWFPERHALYVDNAGNGVREVRIPIDGTGKGESSPLSLNKAFPLDGADPYIMPIAIFCDINAGQGAKAKSEFEQKGRQLVDGHHSHPQHLVGP
jgi:hypothetical protein